MMGNQVKSLSSRIAVSVASRDSYSHGDQQPVSDPVLVAR
jgi:hypothetical protein